MKPDRASDYRPEGTEQARAVCLHISTILGDLMDDLVIVGGLVPSLIVDQNRALERHVGTNDLDVALGAAVLDDQRYSAIADRLRSAGFLPDLNPKGNQAKHRWRMEGVKVTIDFLIGRAGDREPGRTFRLEDDFGAIVIAGAELAFRDSLPIVMTGLTLDGHEATRTVHVCGPGAFVVLKARALQLRGEPKDAYDLVYMLASWPDGIEDIAARVAALRGVDPDLIDESLACLAGDFASERAIGPGRVADFNDGQPAEETRAQAYAFTDAFLRDVR